MWSKRNSNDKNSDFDSRLETTSVSCLFSQSNGSEQIYIHLNFDLNSDHDKFMKLNREMHASIKSIDSWNPNFEAWQNTNTYSLTVWGFFFKLSNKVR